MSKLILTRHGQSIWNAENRFTGWVDVDLSEKGVEEAEESGELIKKLNIKMKNNIFKVLKYTYYLSLTVLLKKYNFLFITISYLSIFKSYFIQTLLLLALLL